MSRFDFRCPIDTSLTFAFGVDHVCGTFLQILNSEDEAILGIDNLGVNADCVGGEELKNLDLYIPGLLALIDETKSRFAQERINNPPYVCPNLDPETICKFARKLGLDDIDKLVYQAID